MTRRHNLGPSLAIALLVLGISALPAHAAGRYSALVVDTLTGKALHDDRADELRHPASLAKLMTLYLLFLEVDTRRRTLDDRLTVSAAAASRPSSKLGLRPGQVLTVEQAILALTVRSANDVAVAVAEAISGTEKEFAKLMNHRARFLGMRQTVFRNASGLHHPEQVSTARDMARLARAVQRRFPDFYHYFSAGTFKFDQRTYRNHNSFLWSYQGADGLKTGFIAASGYNLAASARRGNERLIGVVFGTSSSSDRDQRMRRMLDRSFVKLQRQRAGQTLSANTIVE